MDLARRSIQILHSVQTRVYSFLLVLGLNSNVCAEASPHQVILGYQQHVQEEFNSIQLNSDTVYMEIESDPTDQGLSPTRLPFQTQIKSSGCYL